MLVRLVVVSLLLSLTNGLQDVSNETPIAEEKEKAFSIFNIVRFKNQGCRSASSLAGSGTGSLYRNGTCYERNQCLEKGGQISGTCAAGIGVCCVFTTDECPGSVNHNCSYIRNPGYPSPLTNTYGAQKSCTYTIQKCDPNVCQVRLDFETFALAGPSGSDEADGGACETDQFTVSNSPTGTATTLYPVICGLNSGQHIYIDMGAFPNDNVQINFDIANDDALSRQWEIKVTQIPCGASWGAPPGCLQYHTGCEGRFTTFNFEDTSTSHLAQQCYDICIRQEAGYCCIKYHPCNIDGSYSFSNVAGPVDGIGMNDVECLADATDFLLIQGASNNCCRENQFTRYCGEYTYQMGAAHYPICDCSPPFKVGIFTNSLPDDASGDFANRGLCFNYEQVPCGSGI